MPRDTRDAGAAGVEECASPPRDGKRVRRGKCRTRSKTTHKRHDEIGNPELPEFEIPKLDVRRIPGRGDQPGQHSERNGRIDGRRKRRLRDAPASFAARQAAPAPHARRRTRLARASSRPILPGLSWFRFQWLDCDRIKWYLKYHKLGNAQGTDHGHHRRNASGLSRPGNPELWFPPLLSRRIDLGCGRDGAVHPDAAGKPRPADGAQSHRLASARAALRIPPCHRRRVPSHRRAKLDRPPSRRRRATRGAFCALAFGPCRGRLFSPDWRRCGGRGGHALSWSRLA